jgi:hypothetical protein
MQKLQAKNKREGKSADISYRDIVYMNGIAYVAIGLLLKVPIYALVPQTSIAVLSAQNFLYTTALDYFVLSTKMTQLTFTSVVVVFFGMVLAIAENVNYEDVSFSFGDIMRIFFSYRSIAFTVSTIAFMIGMMELFRISQFELNSSLRLFYISVVAAVFASWLSTLMKATVEVFVYDFFSPSKVRYPVSWLILAILSIVIGIYKMKFTSSALHEFSSYRFLPVYQVR